MKRRGLSLAAGLLLMLGVIIASVVYPSLNARLFEDALMRNVAPSAAVSEDDLRLFAAETISYLNHEEATWSPQIRLDDQALEIPDAFAEHMRIVRNVLGFAQAAACLCILLAAVLLTLCLLPKVADEPIRSAAQTRPSSPRSSLRMAFLNAEFSVSRYLLGAAIPLLLGGGACGWAAVDFNGFWAWLHYTFIPNGIFDANEPIMRLFPLSLFGDYLAPVLTALAIGLAVVALVPILFSIVRLHKRRS